MGFLTESRPRIEFSITPRVRQLMPETDVGPYSFNISALPVPGDLIALSEFDGRTFIVVGRRFLLTRTGAQLVQVLLDFPPDDVLGLEAEGA